jgi:aminopeptidase N
MRFLGVLALVALPATQETVLTSGRPIPAEQACYDVFHYGLDVRVDPEKRAIQGQVTVSGRVLAASKAIVLDLDEHLKVERVSAADRELPFTHRRGEIRIESSELFQQPNSQFQLAVAYGGKPREAPMAPWDGGFVWAKTRDGKPWIATANQMQGADLWWPCKDQPDDEPDSMDIRVTVPVPLVVASNGRLAGVADAEQGWRTYHWHVSTPINAYGVALNIAPYETITREVTSVAGDVFPVTYWVLPENLEKGKVLFEDIVRQMRTLEELYGPYPFRADKYGVAETPHLGMEHQTIIAYGNEYKGNPWGEDYGCDMLHLHEFAHEWWANLVTAKNWNDFWIHEGFASHAQALYVERLVGPEAYFREMAAQRHAIQNRAAVAPREPRSTADMYFGNRPDSPGSDIYAKGGWILHTLRWLLGDESFFRALRRMAYPDRALEQANDGRACRFATTDEIQEIAEAAADRELDWFFEVYLRQPALPRLETRVKGGELHLEWQASGERAFPMPVEVRLGAELVRVECPDGKGRLALGGQDHVVDPRGWLLREEDGGKRGR